MRILVTGASTGLGLATADALARAGHQVVLHARRPDRIGDPVLAERMHALVFGDLSSADETREVARTVNDLGRLDAVIHNAGVIDGQHLIGVNVVAPYVLMASLALPRRSIVLSSSMHLSGSIDLDRAFAKGCDYSTSKLLLTALAMASGARNSTTLSHAVDPGWVPTRMGGPNAPDDLDEGHRTQEWLATAPEDKIVPSTGGYWHHHRTRRPHPATLDPVFQTDLIRRLEALTGLELPSN